MNCPREFLLVINPVAWVVNSYLLPDIVVVKSAHSTLESGHASVLLVLAIFRSFNVPIDMCSSNRIRNSTIVS